MLNDRERLVRQCIVMRLKEKEAMAFLKANGELISPKTYWRCRGRLQAEKRKRLFEIGQSGFEDQHLWRIDTLELVEQELWKCYFKGDYKGAGILRNIAEIQPYLASFYSVTKQVIENQRPEQTDNSLSALTDSEPEPSQ
jgi:hypothetical protein